MLTHETLFARILRLFIIIIFESESGFSQLLPFHDKIKNIHTDLFKGH